MNFERKSLQEIAGFFYSIQYNGAAQTFEDGTALFVLTFKSDVTLDIEKELSFSATLKPLAFNRKLQADAIDLSFRSFEDNFSFQVGNPYPNPMKTQTSIPVVLPQAMDVGLTAIDILGQEVQWSMHKGEKGMNTIIWDHVEDFPKGVYMLRIQAGRESKIVKVVKE